MSMPKVYAGRRRRFVGLLVANGIAQATAGFGLAMALRELLRSAESGTIALPWLGAMIVLGLVVLALRIREASDAELLGQDYVMRVRVQIFDRVAVRPVHADARSCRASASSVCSRASSISAASRVWWSRGSCWSSGSAARSSRPGSGAR
jgi:ABC-type siderophore export system fused ATPase/permease subunit